MRDVKDKTPPTRAPGSIKKHTPNVSPDVTYGSDVYPIGVCLDCTNIVKIIRALYVASSLQIFSSATMQFCEK